MRPAALPTGILSGFFKDSDAICIILAEKIKTFAIGDLQMASYFFKNSDSRLYPYLPTFQKAEECTEMRFAIVVSKYTGEETGKTHLSSEECFVFRR